MFKSAFLACNITKPLQRDSRLVKQVLRSLCLIIFQFFIFAFSVKFFRSSVMRPSPFPSNPSKQPQTKCYSKEAHRLHTSEKANAVTLNRKPPKPCELARSPTHKPVHVVSLLPQTGVDRKTSLSLSPRTTPHRWLPHITRFCFIRYPVKAPLCPWTYSVWHHLKPTRFHSGIWNTCYRWLTLYFPL